MSKISQITLFFSKKRREIQIHGKLTWGWGIAFRCHITLIKTLIKH